MYRKAVFALAGVFLIIALVVPPILFIAQENEVERLIVEQDNPAHATGGNYTAPLSEIDKNYQTTFIIVTIIDVVFIILFVVTLYFGINHKT